LIVLAIKLPWLSGIKPVNGEAFWRRGAERHWALRSTSYFGNCAGPLIGL
jgi:hypothetical protein